MLISLTLSNCACFKEPAEFWMIPFPKLAQHKQRPVPIAKYRMKLLPAAAVFGANGSGKTQLLRVLGDFAAFVLEGASATGRRPVPFLTADPSEDSTVTLSFFAANNIYAFEAHFTKTAITLEKLTLVKTNREEVLYERKSQNFTGRFFQQESLRNLAFGTTPATLFLTRLIEEGAAETEPVARWFRSLRFSDTFGQGARKAIGLPPAALLSSLGLGVDGFAEEPAYLDALSSENRSALLAAAYRNPGVEVELPLPNGAALRALAKKESNEVTVRKITPALSGVALSEKDLPRGFSRILNLVSSLGELIRSPQPAVLFVDDFDRDLHPLLAKKLLADFLSALPAGKPVQLILTAKSPELLDQTLFRRDEIWFADRTESNGAQLKPLSAFVDEKGHFLRFDKVIRPSYLKGLFGGVPHLSEPNLFLQP